MQHLNRCSVKESGALSSALERDLLFTARADTGSVVLGGRDTDLVPARGTESMFRPFPVIIIEDILRHDFTMDETLQVARQRWHIFHPVYNRTLLLPCALHCLASGNRPL